MICVSIGRGRHRHMIAEHRHLVEQGAELVELRLDYINSKINLKRLVSERPGPVIVTCRRKSDGGKFNGTEEQRLMLLRAAIADGVEYVDLEEDIADQIPRYGKTKRIISFHDFRKTPKDLDELHARLVSLDADVVKIASMANDPHDNLRMLRLSQQSEVPTTAFCMGDIGTPSRLLCGRFGAPFTYATFHQERALAPGQLSFQEMRDIYHYDKIDAETQIFGVIADPIGHTLSPQLHNAAFAQEGINAVYIPFRVPPEALTRFVDDATAIGIRGLSVTIPHKEAIAEKLTAVDPAVKGIEAVNTVIFDGDQVKGYNTDYKAAMDSLENAQNQLSGTETPDCLQGKMAMILGAGGAARAVAYGLRRRKANFVVASRTPERAKEVADKFGGRAVDWAARHGVGADYLINCTPVGMHPNVEESPYDKHRLRPSMLVFDTVYNPEQTLLIKDARSQSSPVITGVDMFVRQASWQFYLFTGQQAPADLMRAVLKRAIGPVKY